MNSKRSYLDNLNAGRQRRSGSALDEISRTLDQLESRLNRGSDARGERPGVENDITRRMERLSDRAGLRRNGPVDRPIGPAGRETSSRASLERIARDIEHSKRQEDQLVSLGGITDELKALREDMRAAMGGGLVREFNTLREELARVTASIPRSPLTEDLNREFERLSGAIAQLAERSDDKSTKLLRLELEQVKSALAELAREESVRALDQRWDVFENQISGLQHASDPAIERLSARLEEISAAVNNLPESLSLRSLEERVRSLAGSIDQFTGHRETGQPDLYAMVEERLDEISRAITASAALAHSPTFDASALERIEARITSLANQIDEVVQDRPGGMIVERLNALSERVDEIGRRIEVPEQVVEHLAAHIARISEKFDTVPQRQETDHLFRGLEDRFDSLSELLERRQEDAIQQGQSLLHDLEKRLREVADRLDQSSESEGTSGIMAAIEDRFAELAARIESARQETGDGIALSALEARLEDISGRLQTSAAASHGIDPEVVRNLETQVASLATHLAQPGHDLPDFDDLALRLEKIERSINENRAVVLTAAREAAEEAVEKLTDSGDEPRTSPLRHELEMLHALTRKADERNTKTFEAIHDTLLKIVDRLGALESGGIADLEADALSLGGTPSIDPAAAYRFDDGEVAQKRSPAEAAAAAAEAALMDDTAETEEARGRRGVLGGLSRAFSAKRERVVEEDAREEPSLAVEAEDSEPTLEAERVNEPLEPGSGTPDLSAIMRRVRDERGLRQPASAEAAKADFIAAARRAAQAAAAEAEILKDHRTESTDQGGKRVLGSIFNRNKKKLLLTIGAAIVIAGGVQFGRTLLQENDAPAPMAETEEPTSQEPAVAENKSPAPEIQDEVATPVRMVDEPAPEASVSDVLATEKTGIAVASASPVSTPPEDATVPSQFATSSLSADEALDTASDESHLDIPEIPVEVSPAALREAAADGDATAFFEIASRYAEGHGVPADLAKAAQWYELAAEQGLAPAQYRIGNLYENGTGVERDVPRAKMWYQLAAEQGNASAMHNLGVLYAMGASGDADNEAAARWFRQAAELGVTDSQFNLGILSAKGVGVPRDLVDAYKWFNVVAESGDPDAAAKRDELAAVMAPADLAKAQREARLWEPRELDPEANVVDIPEEWGTSPTTTASIDPKKVVANIQLILNNNGFDAGPADGVMGEKTRTAIRAFQKQNGMAETGAVDEKLVRALLEQNKGVH